MRISSRKPAAARPATARADVPARARPGRPANDGFSKGGPRARADLAVVLDAASRVRRADSPTGTERLLTEREEARARAALAKVPRATAEALGGLLAAHRGDGAQVAHALLLKAVAARADVLPDGRALATLETFSAALATLTPDQMLERATVLDLDPTRNTSRLDAQALWERRGVVHARGDGDTAADNDGLIQRFTATCGPTTLQMLLAEADPVLAFTINRDGKARDATRGPVADFQRAVLEEFGGIAVGRRESFLLARLNNAFGRLERAGEVTEAQRGAALGFVKGGPQRDGAADGLEACRARYGFPTSEEVARLRAAHLPRTDEGLGFAEFEAALEKYAARVLGTGFRQTEPPEGFGRREAAQHLDAVERALRRGFDVPLGLCEPAHWMLLTSVRGRGEGREFLVSDPDGGRTAWVAQADLVSGRFADAQFHLPKAGERPYVDCFYLPELS